jgi:hypothetical protein
MERLGAFIKKMVGFLKRSGNGHFLRDLGEAQKLGQRTIHWGISDNEYPTQKIHRKSKQNSVKLDLKFKFLMMLFYMQIRFVWQILFEVKHCYLRQRLKGVFFIRLILFEMN